MDPIPSNVDPIDIYFDEFIDEYKNDKSTERMISRIKSHNSTVRRRIRRRKAAKGRSRSKSSSSCGNIIDTSDLEKLLRAKDEVLATLAQIKKEETIWGNLMNAYHMVMKDTSKMSEEEKANHELHHDSFRRQIAAYKEEERIKKMKKMKDAGVGADLTNSTPK